MENREQLHQKSTKSTKERRLEVGLKPHPSPQVIPSARTTYIDWFGIPGKFKVEITEEYNRRLEEYYKITGREKRLVI